MEDAKLQFTGFHVLQVALQREQLLSLGASFHVDFSEVSQPHVTEKDKFRSLFVVSLTTKDDPKFNLMVQAAGDFTIIGTPSEKVLKNFTDISAPSIVFPYIRAFVSSLMTQSGMPPAYLPPINFATIERRVIEPATPEENPPTG